MGPIIILDKSAIHAFSGDESMMLRWYFKECLTPILAAEILGDLAKSFKKGKTGEAEVAKLARKFGGSGPAICVEYSKACVGNLLGMEIPMRGTIPVDYAQSTPDGRGAIIDLHPVNWAIMRWSQGRYSEAERQASAYWRENRKKMGVRSMEERLTRSYVIVQPARSLDQVVSVADGLLDAPGLQAVWLDWLLEELAVGATKAAQVRLRWRTTPLARLATFAPYAHHCLRVQLCYYLAVKNRLLGDRDTNMLDVRYLYYLPFCMVFCSGDVAHDTLAPMLVRPDQSYVTRAEMKAALSELLHRNPPYKPNDYVDSASAGSDLPLLATLWRRHCRFVPRALVPGSFGGPEPVDAAAAVEAPRI